MADNREPRTIQHKWVRIPTLPDYWQNFFLCLLLHMIVPLLPLILEFWHTKSVSETTVLLAAAMYTIGIGISSQSRLLFGLAVVASIAYSFAFGVATGQHYFLPASGISAWCGIGAVFLVHALERYNRHVVDRTPFLEFVS